MRPYLEEYFGNPSSMNLFGTRSRAAIEKARKQVAGLLGCKPHEVIFTSGGTESNNLAIKGIAQARKNRGRHIITSSVEHPAVSEVCRHLEKEGFSISWLPVDESGIISPDDLEKALRNDTILVTIMHANNETGSIQPVGEISGVCRKHGVIFHTDAAQSAGKIDIRHTGADLVSLAGHKFYAPKGVGALYIREGVKLEKILHGADHEQDLRPGTENVLEIVGLGKAAEIALRDLPENEKRFRELRDRLEEMILAAIPTARVNGHRELRLPNTLNISFLDLDANMLLSELQDEIAASAGAACHAGDESASSVLKAMGVPPEYLPGAVRFSAGRFLSMEDIETAAEKVIRTVQQAGGSVVSQDKGHGIRLTQYTQGLGCACKLRPQVLEELMSKMLRSSDPDILVGLEKSDDAAVYRINDTQAIVLTVDFFTPIVDDPHDFGASAAANALSDVYAMGARPLFALNIVGFPLSRLPAELLEKILEGAGAKAAEAGIAVIGGHSIEDVEPKFGMTVAGIVDPARIITNSGAKEGDILVLTKPLGTGILSTAMKRGLLGKEEEKALLDLMKRLNKDAAEIMIKYPVNSCTDISGFGLLGHLKEMVRASGVTAQVDSGAVKSLPGVEEMIAAGLVPGGTLNNLRYVQDIVEWGSGIPEIRRIILCDAQTSGGLLISVPGEEGKKMTEEMISRNIEAEVIGKVIVGKAGIRVIRS